MRKTHVLALAGVIIAGVSAISVPAYAVPDCPNNTICLWGGPNGQGYLYKWTGGYHDLPAELHDHVGSFRANRGGAFINYNHGTKECRTVHAGDYRDNYRGDFGGVMDAVGNNC